MTSRQSSKASISTANHLTVRLMWETPPSRAAFPRGVVRTMSMVPPGVARCISWTSRSPQNSRPLCRLGPRTRHERRWPLEARASRGRGVRVAGTLHGVFEASIGSSICSSPPSPLVRPIRSRRTSGAPSSVSRTRKPSSGGISPSSPCRSSPALQLAPLSSPRLVARTLR